MQLSEVASSITNKQIVPSFQQLDQRKTAQLPSISRNHLKLRPAEAKKKGTPFLLPLTLAWPGEMHILSKVQEF